MAGLYYEDLTPGLVIDHAIRRTVTEADNTLFSALTCNPAPLHLDAEYAKTTVFGQRVVNSLFTLSLVAGLQVYETTLGTTVANLGFEEVRFPSPVFPGDTIHVRTEVLSRRESSSRPDAGIVSFKHTAFNQHDAVVCECRRNGLMLKRAATPVA